jgi:hypothetical protein
MSAPKCSEAGWEIRLRDTVSYSTPRYSIMFKTIDEGKDGEDTIRYLGPLHTVQRREIITVRGQSYVSRLPKY